MGNTHSKKLRKKFKRHVLGPITDTQTHTTDTNIPDIKVIAVDNNTERTIGHTEDHTSGSILPLSRILSKETVASSSNKPTDEILSNEGRYQNYCKQCVLPLGEEEQDRLIQEHFLFKYIFGGNFSAPVRDLLSGPFKDPSIPKRNSACSGNLGIEYPSPPRVLDIACGNGTWLLEMATEFSNSQFYGIDCSPSFPTTVKPPNAFFCQYNVLHPDGLPYPNNHFDYVFMRQVSTCFSESDWTLIIKDIRRVLKPGGYVEFREADPVLKGMGEHSSKIFTKYPSLMKEKYGVNVLWSRYMFENLQNVGEMTDMHRTIKKLQFGLPGSVGKMIDTSLRLGFESRRLFFEDCYHIPSENFDEMVNNIVNEAIDRHSFFNYHLCWGRKPLLDYDSSTSLRKGSASSVLTFEDALINKAENEQKDDSCKVGSLTPDNELCIYQFIEGFED